MTATTLDAPQTTASRAREAVYRYGLLVLLLALVLWFSAATPQFATVRNLLVVLQSVAIVCVVALGVTVSLVAGGFDLSVGATVGLTVMVTAATQVYWALPGWVAVLAGLATGAAVGLVNGLLVVLGRVPDLLATLGTMFVVQGLALVLTSGQSVSSGSTVGGEPAPGAFDPAFLWLGRGVLLGVPVPVLVTAAVAVLVAVLLTRTRQGRLLEAVGGNPVAARLAGVHVGRLRVLAYVLSGTLASVGGILLAGRLGRGDVGAGAPYLLETVAAALIGFAVLGANRPHALGTVVGALFVGVVINGLTMQNAPYYTQDLIKGVLLVGALVLSFSALFRRKELL
ncbi:ABC transporter permease [Cellulomonas oligotrophica]|uniref:Monosaccharide-transporting ATPase n=1 Tax=Cellulomonas oligotrophica TaxID=931536 RepID=A0A7Y9FF20_9CELL|nr:ABC transporter permease [Cellulomonas oligotrophica]NYD86139.1 simple sugar transport system permease protein [Cellulomonas oligotrophica]GIG30853.1 monosaccharide-transporting ATPase [Cellulomonas oligotrophica]